MEIEAKFILPDAQTLQRLQVAEQLAGYCLGPGKSKHVRDTYMDTPDRKILAAGYVCRQRQEAGAETVLITVKGLGGVEGGVHRRDEIEVTLPAPLPPAEWPEGPARERVLGWIGQEALAPLFSLEQDRTVRLVEQDGRPVAEMSLDEVQLQAGSRKEVSWEVEAELSQEGAEADMAAIAAELEHGWRLQPQHLSKFERAMALLQNSSGGRLFNPEERALVLQIAACGDLHGRRARALLALDEGVRQEEAGRLAGMSARRVRYWLATFRLKKLGVFPSRVRPSPPGPPARGGEPEGKRGEKEPAPAEPASPPRSRGGRRGRAAPETPGLPSTQEEPAPAQPVSPPRSRGGRGGRVAPEISAPPSSGGEPETPPRPSRPGITPDDSMAEAARKTLLFHLHKMLDHEKGTREGKDVEDLHDMRVATRRMRAALRFFADYLDPDELRPYNKALRCTGRALGAVRDLDVFQEKVQHYLQELPEEQRSGLDPLLAAWKDQYEQSRGELLECLDGPRYARLRDDFPTFLQTPGAGALPALSEEGVPQPHRVRHVLPGTLYGSLAAVRAYDEWLQGPNVPFDRYHRLRIASKGLRYALEFFQEVLGPKDAELIRRMKDLQDHLGELHDAVVASGLLRDFITWGTWGHAETRKVTLPVEPVVAPGVVAYLAVRQTEIQQLVNGFPEVWEKVRGAEFGRLLGLSLATLL